MRLIPETLNLKDKNVTTSILGYPVSSVDIVLSRVIWRKTLVINDKHMTGVRAIYSGSTIQSNIDFDFTERVYDVHFYSLLDILS